MLRDFAKINTFLTVVRQKSFSKASKKLGISQPAVTQQIKLLESYLKTSIVDRKKNGIGLTKSGKDFYKIAQKVERFINNTEKEVMQIIDKKATFMLGSSHSIAKYIVSRFLGNIKDAIGHDINVQAGTSKEILELLIDRKIDMALVGVTAPNNAIMYREWLSDELVLCSKSKLPQYFKKEALYDYKWLTRDDNSTVHTALQDSFLTFGVDYNKFDIASVVNSSTVIKQTLLKTEITNNKKPLIAFMSKHAIRDEVENGTLNMARIRGLKFDRKLYVAYLKDEKQNALIDTAANYIISKSKL